MCKPSIYNMEIREKLISGVHCFDPITGVVFLTPELPFKGSFHGFSPSNDYISKGWIPSL